MVHVTAHEGVVDEGVAVLHKHVGRVDPDVRRPEPGVLVFCAHHKKKKEKKGGMVATNLVPRRKTHLYLD